MGEVSSWQEEEARRVESSSPLACNAYIRLTNGDSTLTNVDSTLTNADSRLSNVDSRLTNNNSRLTNVDRKLTNIDSRLTNTGQENISYLLLSHKSGHVSTRFGLVDSEHVQTGFVLAPFSQLKHSAILLREVQAEKWQYSRLNPML
jgi:hypothetical protein